MIEFANRMKRFDTPAAPAIAEKLAALSESGADVIDLSSPWPDLEPAYETREAAIDAVRDGNTAPSLSGGLPALRTALAARFTAEGVAATAANTLVTPGASFAVYAALQALVNDGDEVAVFTPGRPSDLAQVKLAGGVPRIIPLNEDDGFRLDPDTLEKQVPTRVRGILLASPADPTGIAWAQDELSAVADIAVKRNLFIIADESSSAFRFEGEGLSMASLSAQAAAQTVTVTDLSAELFLPGWRVGGVTGPESFIKKFADIQAFSASHAHMVSQLACLAALGKESSHLEKAKAEYRERRDFLVSALRGLHGFRFQAPDGGLSIFANIQYYLGKEVGGEVPGNSAEFARILLSKAGVAVVPGSHFGAEGYVRISFTQPLQKLQEAVKRMRPVLEK